MDTCRLHACWLNRFWRKFFDFFKRSDAVKVILLSIIKQFLNFFYFRAFDMETEVGIDDHYRFPYFELCNFYAAAQICKKLEGLINKKNWLIKLFFKEYRSTTIPAPELMLKNGKNLLSRCEEWITKDTKKQYIFFEENIKQLRTLINDENKKLKKRK